MKISGHTSKALAKNEWPLSGHGDLTLLFSPLLLEASCLVHAFTTRMGGQTPAPLNWFNLGRHLDCEQSRLDASRNRAKLCQALSLDYELLTVPAQKHTTNIYHLKENAPKAQHLMDYDGVVTASAGHPALLHFADCVPVMIFDTRRKALCVLHAGWRGTAGGIVRKGVDVLKSTFGCRSADMLAAVGPAIGSCCYQTGEDVSLQLSASIANPTGLVEKRNGNHYPDLKAINAMQLVESGVESVDVSAWCTACHPQIFYSHRQSGGHTGRQGAIACIRQAPLKPAN